jgi:hypothetical protein
MSTRKTCDKCKHYTAPVYYPLMSDAEQNQGECGLIGDSNKGTPHADRAYGWDYEAYVSGAYVGPKFGCIHWDKA